MEFKTNLPFDFNCMGPGILTLTISEPLEFPNASPNWETATDMGPRVFLRTALARMVRTQINRPYRQMT